MKFILEQLMKGNYEYAYTDDRLNILGTYQTDKLFLTLPFAYNRKSDMIEPKRCSGGTRDGVWNIMASSPDSFTFYKANPGDNFSYDRAKQLAYKICINAELFSYDEAVVDYVKKRLEEKSDGQQFKTVEGLRLYKEDDGRYRVFKYINLYFYILVDLKRANATLHQITEELFSS